MSIFLNNIGIFDACDDPHRTTTGRIRVVKRKLGFTKVRYRGLGKNTAQLTTLLALSNLYLVRRQLLWVSVDKCAR